MFTIQEFIDLDILPWYKIVSGKEAFDVTPIEFVCVMELPVSDFVRENELVITTALGCHNNEDNFFKLIRDVHISKASGLLLTNEEDNIVLPAKCLKYVQKRNFPVIIIPWEIRFADLMELILQNIRKESNSQNTKFENLQKKLLLAYLDGSSFHEAAQIISKALKCHCALLDTNLEIKGADSYLAKQSINDITIQQSSNIIPLVVEHRTYGYLYLKAHHCEKPHELEQLRRYIFSPLTLWYDKEVVIFAARQNSRDDFVWQLTKGHSLPLEEISRQGEILGFNLKTRYTCVTAKLNVKNQLFNDEDLNWISGNIVSLKEEILASARELERSLMLTYQNSLLIIYYETLNGISGKDINNFLNKIEEKSKMIFPKLVFHWGISEASTDVPDFSVLFNHAKLALELCSSSNNKNERYTFKNTMLSSMLSVIAGNSKLNRQARNIITPLIEYDNAKNMNLVETLQAYLYCKNTSKTARALNLHRQSLLYRLNKIEDLIEMSLKDSDNLLLLDICLRLYMD